MLSGLSRLVTSGTSRGQETATSVLNTARGGQRKRVPSVALSDPYAAFARNWEVLETNLTAPDQAALHHGISRTDIPERLERLTMALISESTAIDEAMDGMGPCMEHILKRDVLSVLVSSAIANRPSGILIEAVKTFQALIANLDARFLSQQAVNKPLVRLIRYCVADEDVDSAWGQEEGFEHNDENKNVRTMTPEETANLHETLVGLMAFVASKLHNAKELLHIFFHDRQRDVGTTQQPPRPVSPAGSTSSTATLKAAPVSVPTPAQRSYDFPLFTYLLRFVHAEGQTGSLARAGLSVIVKIAFEGKSAAADTTAATPPSRKVRFSGDEEQDDRIEEEHSATLDLAEYILASDFVVVIGASLGAVYGLLPSKLAILAPKQSEQNTGGGMCLGARDDRSHREDIARLERLNIEPSTNPQIADRLLLFVDILQFVQTDVLARAAQGSLSALGKKAIVAHELIQRLAESIRLSLMTNILYPSMVESGDRDGSAVAVMTYLEVLLTVLDDSGPLADEIVGWLIRQEEDEGREASTAAALTTPTTPSSGRGQRRKSAALLLLEQDHRREDTIFDPLLHYTIKNLISDHVSSTTSHATVAAALGLARAFLARHQRFAPSALISVVADDTATCFPFHLPPLYSEEEEEDEDSFQYPGSVLSPTPRSQPTAFQPTVSLSQHLREIDLYFSLIAALDAPLQEERTSFSSSTGYENYLRDAEEALLSDPTYLCGVANTPVAAQAPFRHRLDAGDALLRSIIARLRRFFEQPPELNVSLTSLIYSMCLCPYMSLEGWLTFERDTTDTGSFEEEGEESEDWRREPKNSQASANPLRATAKPIILQILRLLVDHVQNYRSQVPDFDRFLAERRKGLLFVENLSDALQLDSALDDENGTDTSQPSTSIPSTRGATRKLWETVGIPEEKVNNDVQVVDVRDVKLPPRPSDDTDEEQEQKVTNAAQAQGPASLLTLSRLFGRSTRNRKTTASSTTTTATSSTASTTTTIPTDSNPPIPDPTPFADHYAQTAAISLEPTFIPLPKGPWTARRVKTMEKKRTRFQLVDEHDEDHDEPSSTSSSSSFTYPGLEDDEEEEARRTRGRVTLSALLDNVVVLEEFVKELCAVIQVRRSMGIDLVGLLE